MSHSPLEWDIEEHAKRPDSVSETYHLYNFEGGETSPQPTTPPPTVPHSWDIWSLAAPFPLATSTAPPQPQYRTPTPPWTPHNQPFPQPSSVTSSLWHDRPLYPHSPTHQFTTPTYAEFTPTKNHVSQSNQIHSPTTLTTKSSPLRPNAEVYSSFARVLFGPTHQHQQHQ